VDARPVHRGRPRDQDPSGPVFLRRPAARRRPRASPDCVPVHARRAGKLRQSRHRALPDSRQCVHCDYAVTRLAQARQNIGPLLTLTGADPLLARAVSLFKGVAGRSFRDHWAAAALFEFLFEYERLAHRRLYPEAQRASLPEEVRRFVLGHRTVAVADLAAQSRLSRSHFSHRFKAATGLPPAQWVRQVQLEEATRQLLATGHKLETIARSCGFADATTFPPASSAAKCGE